MNIDSQYLCFQGFCRHSRYPLSNSFNFIELVIYIQITVYFLTFSLFDSFFAWMLDMRLLLLYKHKLYVSLLSFLSMYVLFLFLIWFCYFIYLFFDYVLTFFTLIALGTNTLHVHDLFLFLIFNAYLNLYVYLCIY